LERLVEHEAQGEEAKVDAPERKTLFELALPIRGLLTDEEIDTLFARDRSPSRTIDF
jgi:hypothetical protein